MVAGGTEWLLVALTEWLLVALTEWLLVALKPDACSAIDGITLMGSWLYLIDFSFIIIHLSSILPFLRLLTD